MFKEEIIKGLDGTPDFTRINIFGKHFFCFFDEDIKFFLKDKNFKDFLIKRMPFCNEKIKLVFRFGKMKLFLNEFEKRKFFILKKNCCFFDNLAIGGLSNSQLSSVIKAVHKKADEKYIKETLREIEYCKKEILKIMEGGGV